MNSSKHLDLGCGTIPRNPYNCDYVFGVDIREDIGLNIKKCNLSAENLPFDDCSFDAISAYDLLEHIPRVAIDFRDAKTTFPFINLMNEIHRVLRVGGSFYASTPAFPSHAVFVDPTHVNFITKETHRYFIGENPTAKMYGFNGKFESIRTKFYVPRYDYEPIIDTPKILINRLKDFLKKRRSHMLWELRKF
jgi:SAM-dependent methyltransferase